MQKVYELECKQKQMKVKKGESHWFTVV